MLQDADTVNQFTRDGNRRTLPLAENCIKYSLTVGAYHAETNTLASWAVLMPYGAIGLVATHPEHRRKGLAKAVVSSLCVKLLDHNFDIIPYCYIVQNNIASINLFESLGFKLLIESEVLWDQITLESK